MGFAHIFLLHLIFHGLHGLGWIYAVHSLNAGRNVFKESIVDNCLIQQHGIFLSKLLHILIYLIIRTDRDSRFLQFTADLSGNSLLLHIEEYILLCEDHIGEDHGIAFNIIASDIQKPCNIVQTGEKMDVSAVFSHDAADICQFFFSGSAHIFHIHKKCLLF